VLGYAAVLGDLQVVEVDGESLHDAGYTIYADTTLTPYASWNSADGVFLPDEFDYGFGTQAQPTFEALYLGCSIGVVFRLIILCFSSLVGSYWQVRDLGVV